MLRLGFVFVVFSLACGGPTQKVVPAAKADEAAGEKPARSCGAGGCGSDAKKGEGEKPACACGAGSCGGEAKKTGSDEKPTRSCGAGGCGGEVKKGGTDEKPTRSCGAGGCGGEVKKGGDEQKPTRSCGAGGCGGESKPGETKVPPVPAIAPLAKPWATMSHEEREAHMLDKVYPTMEGLFHAVDKTRFKDFSCETCHGSTGAERNYAMPNPDLYKVYPTGTREQEEMVKKHQPTLVFMFNTVVPSMARLLGKPEYDEATGNGFSCFACHTKGEPTK